MKFYYHFNAPHLANTYMIASENSKDAVLIDPGVMDVGLLQLIEDNKYYVRSVLVTHENPSHIDGIKTILKIYKSDVYSANHHINEIPCIVVEDGDYLDLAGIRIETIGVQAFARDALLFKTGRLLFTGDALTAGSVGTVPNTYSRALLIANLKEKLSAFSADTLIFPGFGPPTTVRLEMSFNPDLNVLP